MELSCGWLFSLSLSLLSLNDAVMHLSYGANLNAYLENFLLKEMTMISRLIKVFPIRLNPGDHSLRTVNPLSQPNLVVIMASQQRND
jgi:hypothetical protein